MWPENLLMVQNLNLCSSRLWLTGRLTLVSSGLRASRRWLPLLRSEQCVCGAQGLQGPGRVSQQEGRGEPEEPGPLPQLQGEPEGQVSQLSSPLLRKHVNQILNIFQTLEMHRGKTESSTTTNCTVEENVHRFIYKLLVLLKRETK